MPSGRRRDTALATAGSDTLNVNEDAAALQDVCDALAATLANSGSAAAALPPAVQYALARELALGGARGYGAATPGRCLRPLRATLLRLAEDEREAGGGPWTATCRALTQVSSGSGAASEAKAALAIGGALLAARQAAERLCLWQRAHGAADAVRLAQHFETTFLYAAEHWAGQRARNVEAELRENPLPPVKAAADAPAASRAATAASRPPSAAVPPAASMATATPLASIVAAATATVPVKTPAKTASSSSSSSFSTSAKPVKPEEPAQRPAAASSGPAAHSTAPSAQTPTTSHYTRPTGAAPAPPTNTTTASSSSSSSNAAASAEVPRTARPVELPVLPARGMRSTAQSAVRRQSGALLTTVDGSLTSTTTTHASDDDRDIWLVLARGRAYEAANAAAAAAAAITTTSTASTSARNGEARRPVSGPTTAPQPPAGVTQRTLEHLLQLASGGGGRTPGGGVSPPATPALARRRQASGNGAGEEGGSGAAVAAVAAGEVNPQDFGEDGSWWTRRYALQIRTDLEDDLLSEGSDESRIDEQLLELPDDEPKERRRARGAEGAGTTDEEDTDLDRGTGADGEGGSDDEGDEGDEESDDEEGDEGDEESEVQDGDDE